MSPTITRLLNPRQSAHLIGGVRVLDDWTIKIMDFGIAKSVNNSTGVTKSHECLDV